MHLTEAQLIEQILAAHREVDEGDPGLTIGEIARMTGWTERRARDAVRRLLASGTLAVSRNGVRQAMDGRRARVPVYAPVERVA